VTVEMLTGSETGIEKIDFRSKARGWKQSGGTTEFTVVEDGGDSGGVRKTLATGPLHNNPFMRGFLRDLYLRRSCYQCPARGLRSGSDITIGDFWGIENILPDFDDDRGVSLVMLNTEKGRALYGEIEKDDRETSYAAALAGNPNIEKSVARHPKREAFFREFSRCGDISSLIMQLTMDSFARRVRNRLVRIAGAALRRLGLFEFVKGLLKK